VSPILPLLDIPILTLDGGEVALPDQFQRPNAAADSFWKSLACPCRIIWSAISSRRLWIPTSASGITRWSRRRREPRNRVSEDLESSEPSFSRGTRTARTAFRFLFVYLSSRAKPANWIPTLDRVPHFLVQLIERSISPLLTTSERYFLINRSAAFIAATLRRAAIAGKIFYTSRHTADDEYYLCASPFFYSICMH